MQVAVPGALAQIVDLAARATSEQVRLQAAKDIMDRAGLKPTWCYLYKRETAPDTLTQPPKLHLLNEAS